VYQRKYVVVSAGLCGSAHRSSQNTDRDCYAQNTAKLLRHPGGRRSRIIRANRLYSDHISNSAEADTSTSRTRAVAASGTRQSSEISFRGAWISAEATFPRRSDVTILWVSFFASSVTKSRLRWCMHDLIKFLLRANHSDRFTVRRNVYRICFESLCVFAQQVSLDNFTREEEREKESQLKDCAASMVRSVEEIVHMFLRHGILFP